MARYEHKNFYFLLALLVSFSFVLRIVVYFSLRNTHYPDEVFQVTEPAHRLLFGTGYISWEWVVGARSWLWPGIVAGLMALGHLAGDDPDRILLPVSLFMAAVSTIPVVCGCLWGRRFGGNAGALVVGALNAVWVDLVYMAVHPLSDVVAANCLVLFLYLAYPHQAAEGRARLFWAGVMAGATVVLRIQLGPALAVASIMICGWREPWRRWVPLGLGAMIPVAALGLLDWATLSVPFQSVIVNLQMNLVEHVSTDYGVSPWYGLLGAYFAFWGGALPLFLLCVLGGAWKLPVAAVTAGMIFLTFSLFDHKEYRFAYPAIPLLVTLAGLGTAQAVSFLQRQRLPMFSSALSVPAIAVVLWTATSCVLAASGPYVTLWTRDRSFLKAFHYMAYRPDICGVALYRMSVLLTPGRSGLPLATPLYETDQTRLARDAAGFNALLAWPNASVPDPQFSKAACFDGVMNEAREPRQSVCVWVRAGGCTPGIASPPPVNWPDHLSGRATEGERIDEEYQD